MKRKFMLLLALVLVLSGLTTGFARAQDQVTVKFWHTYNEVSPENKMLTETLIPMFEKAHPNIKVEAVPFPYGEFRQAIVTALAGGEGPDLARLDIIWSPEFAKLGSLEALDTVMPDFKQYADAVFPGPLATNLYNGHYYGLPLDTNTRVWVPNLAVYEKAGITAPPKTIAEIEEQCKLIKKAGENVTLFADGGTYGWAVLPWIWSFGGTITNEEMTKATGYVNSKETVAAYDFLKKMIDEGCFSQSMVGSGQDVGNAFFNNEVANVIEGPWMMAGAMGQHPDVKLEPTQFPAGAGGSISVVGGENIALFAGSKVRDAALEFLRFTQSDEYQQKMSETGQLTVLSRLIETDYFKNHPYYGAFLEQLKTAKPRLVHPAWTKIEEILTNTGQIILRGETPTQEALDAAAAEIDKILEESAKS